MILRDHRLSPPARWVPSPNVGGILKARFLLMHFTAGASARESIAWLANPASKVSAHLVISRDGEVTQMVPFDRVAWHAGESVWRGLHGLNHFALGIELDNPGRMTRGRGDVWTSDAGVRLPESQVVVATHKNEKAPCGWARYPEAQLVAARDVAALLVREYHLTEIVGHDDVAPHRKADPGPAFPMEEFRAAVQTNDQALPSRPPDLRPAPTR